MSTPSLSHDPGNVTVTFLGAVLHGFAPGTYIKASRDEDAFTKQIGADGEVARIRNRNRGGSVELTLQQTSTANDVLSAQTLLDQAGTGGYGPLLIKDPSGTTLLSAPVAWIKKVADVELAKDLTTRTWVFDVAAFDMFVGGNPI
jgi:hypothetical protein